MHSAIVVSHVPIVPLETSRIYVIMKMKPQEKHNYLRMDLLQHQKMEGHIVSSSQSNRIAKPRRK